MDLSYEKNSSFNFGFCIVCVGCGDDISDVLGK